MEDGAESMEAILERRKKEFEKEKLAMRCFKDSVKKTGSDVEYRDMELCHVHEDEFLSNAVISSALVSILTRVAIEPFGLSARPIWKARNLESVQPRCLIAICATCDHQKYLQ